MKRFKLGMAAIIAILAIGVTFAATPKKVTPVCYTSATQSCSTTLGGGLDSFGEGCEVNSNNTYFCCYTVSACPTSGEYQIVNTYRSNIPQ